MPPTSSRAPNPPLPSLQLGDRVLASTSPMYRNAGTRCISCGNLVNKQVNTGGIDTREKGYVKGVVTCTITDDVSIAPLTTISGLTLMKNVKVVDIEERTIIVGVEEVNRYGYVEGFLTVLTDVFLGQGKYLNTLPRAMKKRAGEFM
ncbi:hypothetical protein EJ110_NYTH45403 [Nymphaea thermarum]|nr:hypothetical protein EJ110_NYTH45403 [Nymphaea thermarum]